MSNEWGFNFIRALHAWEESEVSRLTVLLGTCPSLQLEQGDSMRWKADQTGVYKVSNAYRWCGWLKGPAFSSTDLIWNSFASPKTKLITWLAWKSRLKTTEFLSRIGVLMGNVDVLCVFYKEEVESLNHLLLFCPFVWKIWSCIIHWWGMPWIVPGSIEGLLQW